MNIKNRILGLLMIVFTFSICSCNGSLEDVVGETEILETQVIEKTVPVSTRPPTDELEEWQIEYKGVKDKFDYSLSILPGLDEDWKLYSYIVDAETQAVNFYFESVSNEEIYLNFDQSKIQKEATLKTLMAKKIHILPSSTSFKPAKVNGNNALWINPSLSSDPMETTGVSFWAIGWTNDGVLYTISYTGDEGSSVFLIDLAESVTYLE